MTKFPDCESCAFGGGEEPGICDFCEDADQWESYEEMDFSGQSRTVIKIKRTKPARQQEEERMIA